MSSSFSPWNSTPNTQSFGKRSFTNFAENSETRSTSDDTGAKNTWKMPIERYSKYQVKNLLLTEVNEMMNSWETDNDDSEHHKPKVGDTVIEQQQTLNSPFSVHQQLLQNDNRGIAEENHIQVRQRPLVAYMGPSETLSDSPGRVIAQSTSHLQGLTRSSSVSSMTNELIPFGTSRASLMSLFEKSTDRHVIQGDFMQCLHQNPLYSSKLSSLDSLRHMFSTMGETYFKNTPRGRAHARFFFLDITQQALKWCESRAKRNKSVRSVSLNDIDRIVQFEISATDARRFKIDTSSSSSSSSSTCSCIVLEFRNRDSATIGSRTKNLEVASFISMDTMANLAVVLAGCIIEARQYTYASQ